ncbi:MAG: SIMPL domain-containing protein [Actinobacteria bacterium]|nr:SIMPL domain-containing protein [Actinomycetota bacterium]
MRAPAPIAVLVGLALLAGAVAYGLKTVGDGIGARDTRDTVTVTGSAKQRISSDFVIWDAAVSAQSRQPATAAAELGRWTQAVRTFLTSSGVEPAELSVSPISTERVAEVDETGTQRFAAYNLTRTFQVRSARVDAIVQMVQASTRLVSQGVPLTASPPQFIYTKLADLRPTLSAAATKDAINRAQTVVTQAGARLGKLRAISVGPFQLTPPGSTEASDYGTYDTTTRVKDVTSVVNVTFALR